MLHLVGQLLIYVSPYSVSIGVLYRGKRGRSLMLPIYLCLAPRLKISAAAFIPPPICLYNADRDIFVFF